MNNGIEIEDLMERYLGGMLEDNERLEFESKLQNDKKLAEEFNLQKKFYNFITNTDKLELKQQLGLIEKKHRDKKGTSNPGKIKRIIYIAAASIALFGILFGINYLTKNRLNSHEKLFCKYYELPEYRLSNLRSEETYYEINTGRKDYQNGNFESAYKKLNQAIKMDTGNFALHLYAGISAVELEEFETALTHFNIIIQHRGNLFVEEANWYISLVYVKLNKTDKAIEYLKNISQESSLYKIKATELLVKLKKNR